MLKRTLTLTALTIVFLAAQTSARPAALLLGDVLDDMKGTIGNIEDLTFGPIVTSPEVIAAATAADDALSLLEETLYSEAAAVADDIADEIAIADSDDEPDDTELSVMVWMEFEVCETETPECREAVSRFLPNVEPDLITQEISYETRPVETVEFILNVDSTDDRVLPADDMREQRERPDQSAFVVQDHKRRARGRRET